MNYFRAINLTFNLSFPLQCSRKKMKINHGKCSYKQHGSENNEKLKLERLDRSVGANVQTTIHIINCLRMKKR